MRSLLARAMAFVRQAVGTRAPSRPAVRTRLIGMRPAPADPAAAPAPPATDGFERSWRSGVKKRTFVVLGGLAVWVLVVEARLVQVQVLDHDGYLSQALKQQEHTLTVTAPRGDIVDRQGRLLAYSVEAYTISADPGDIVDKAGTAGALCTAFGGCTATDRADLIATLSSKKDFIYVRRQQPLSAEQAARLKGLIKDEKLKGIWLQPEAHRYYPQFDLASHVLGWVNIDNQGQAGIEHVYDEVIRGHEGKLLQLRAGKRTIDVEVEESPTQGASLELTLDLYLQHIAEAALREGVTTSRALGGTAIVMDPNTGEILALANLPTFNPNAYTRFADDDRMDRAVQGVYEPGSTFKIVTASAALQENVWSLSDTIDCSPGVLVLGSRRITEADGHDYGRLVFPDVIVKSSNVGASKIGLRVGAERMERFTRRFGFGQRLSPDFPGESGGIVRPLDKVNDSTLASMSMGYEVSVTPLQMAAAVSAVANGGTLYEPHVVRAIVRGDDRQVIAPKALRTAIAPETAAELTSIMEDVVRRGTGTKAQLTDHIVAGKTGTAAKAIPGGYSKTDYHVSFVGFVPSRKPVLAIVVMVDTPRVGRPYGGEIAAPIFKKIAEASLRQLGVVPTLNPIPAILVAPPLPSVMPVPPPAPVTATPIAWRDSFESKMPDVRGLAMRDALRRLTDLGLVVHPSGSGVVVTQIPRAGDQIEAGDPVTLQFGRAADVRAPGGGGGR